MDTFVVVPLNEGCDVTFQLSRELVGSAPEKLIHFECQGPILCMKRDRTMRKRFTEEQIIRILNDLGLSESSL